MMKNSSVPETHPSLLLRIRDAGDGKSWQEFVDVYGPLIHGYCRKRGLQDADAAEVMQVVLHQVSRSILKFDYQPERGRFRHWLGKVTHSKLANFKARACQACQGVRGTEGPGLGEAPAHDQETAWSEAFNAHVYRTALARVRPFFKTETWRAFEMVWVEDRPAAEAAQELARPVARIYDAKKRVLARLHREVRKLAESEGLFGAWPSHPQT